MPRLVITPRAESSLESISDYYLAEYSVDRAIKVIHSLEEAFERICSSPESYPVCFDIEHPVNESDR